MNIAMTQLQIASQSVDCLSNTANSFVNQFMSTNDTHEIRVIDRKEYNILFRRGTKEIDTIRYYSKTCVEGLSNVLSSIYDQSIKSNQKLVEKYYKEFVGEALDSNSQHGSMESIVMQIVALLSNKLRISVRAMSSVCYSHMSTLNQEILDLIFNKTEQLYAILSDARFGNVREHISIDNVKSIGQNMVDLLVNVNTVLENKYMAETGESPALAANITDGDCIKIEVIILSDYVICRDLLLLIF